MSIVHHFGFAQCRRLSSTQPKIKSIAQSLHGWLHDDRGDMVWHTLVIISVLLPLASLCLDVPRYFTLRARLQLATDAATQAAAQCVDIPHFANTRQVRLLLPCVQSEAQVVFTLATDDLLTKGYQPALTSVTVDELADQVNATASGTTTLFFGLSPQFAIEVEAMSRVRMDQR